MKSWVRMLLFLVGGFVIMSLCLLWVAQFFTGDGDVTPVIWLEDWRTETDASGEDNFDQWQVEKKE